MSQKNDGPELSSTKSGLAKLGDLEKTLTEIKDSRGVEFGIDPSKNNRPEGDISSAEYRLAKLEELASTLTKQMEVRGVAFGDDPKGKTGLYNRKFKIEGSREFPALVEEYSMDRRTLRELHQLRKLAHTERHWMNKREPVQHNIQIRVIRADGTEFTLGEFAESARKS